MNKIEAYLLTCQTSAICVIIISALAIVGWLSGAIRLASWGSAVPMSLPTAVCFIAIAVNGFLLAESFRVTRKE